MGAMERVVTARAGGGRRQANESPLLHGRDEGSARRQEAMLERPSRAWRICLVTETYPPEVNGVALTLARLASGLHARGQEVSMVRPRRPTDDRAHDDPARGGNVTLVPGVPLPGYRGLHAGLPAGARLRARWTARRPDVVYAATEGPLGWSAVRAATRLGVPVWSGFHTNFAEYARHYRMGWLAPLVLGYLRTFHNRTRGTLVATEELRDRLCGLGLRRVSVLGRGVDADLFSPERRSAALRSAWGAGEGDVVALYVGRLAAEKNVPLAVKAYRAMRPVRGATRLVLVGDGPLRRELERAHPDAIFCGMRAGDQLAAHYASADVFLFPSETETFGNVTLEAMASGLVVLAYDYAAARVHVAHRESGVLVPRGDSRGFVEQAALLARRPAELADMRRRARAHAAGFDWPRVVEMFEALLTGGLRDGTRRQGC